MQYDDTFAVAVIAISYTCSHGANEIRERYRSTGSWELHGRLRSWIIWGPSLCRRNRQIHVSKVSQFRILQLIWQVSSVHAEVEFYTGKSPCRHLSWAHKKKTQQVTHRLIPSPLHALSYHSSAASRELECAISQLMSGNRQPIQL